MSSLKSPYQNDTLTNRHVRIKIPKKLFMNLPLNRENEINYN